MIRTGCVEIVAAVLEEGRNTKLEFNWDLNPLQVVALLLREGQYSQDGRIVAIARMLLKAGARPDTGQPTPLMLVDTEWECHFHSSRRYGRQKLSEPLNRPPNRTNQFKTPIPSRVNGSYFTPQDTSSNSFPGQWFRFHIPGDQFSQKTV
jgi:hypothetical protein